MPFVVMQKGLEAPPLEQLKAAFRNVPGLTPMDAAIKCKDSLGILVRGLTQAEAEQIQAALAAQGVETEALDQSALPVLSQMKGLSRVACALDALKVWDTLGRESGIDWRDIMLIAAGRVSVIEFKRENAAPIPQDSNSALGIIDQLLSTNGRYSPQSATVAFPEPNYETREVQQQRWMLEFLLYGEARFHLEAQSAGQPMFEYLGERRTVDVAENFKLLVQDLCRLAPGAVINRGAYYLREGNASAFVYSSKNAFYDEMTWLLWRFKG